MIIRTIKDDELYDFSKIGTNEKNATEFKDLLINWFKEGKSKKEWCFVAEDKNGFCARIVYWVFLDQPLDLKICAFHIDSQQLEEFISIGNALISTSLEAMCLKEFNNIEYHFYKSDKPLSTEYKNLLLINGFNVTQEKKNFNFKTCDDIPQQAEAFQSTSPLYFKRLADVGIDKFIDAIEKVTEGTLDDDLLFNLNEFGPKKAALDYFNVIKGIDYTENWWTVAYDSKDELVGLVVPQKFNSYMGAINYIGVVPKKRGHHFVDQLLFEGTRILKDASVEEIIADIDVKNLPMEDSLLRLGYKYENSVSVLKFNIKKDNLI